ncbi:MAG: N-acetyltransferase [Gammaproteobacteria bacterium]|nr:N-acetyltransferase [Gammaproteobacteria bacterium]
MYSKYQNKNIRIRSFIEADISTMCALVINSAAEFSKYLPWVTSDYNEEHSRMWVSWAHYNWQTQRQYDFVIDDVNTGEFLGGIGLLEVDFNNKCAKLGYWLGTPHTGKGFTTQAAGLIMEFARNELALEKLIIRVAEDNLPSIAIAKKLGAVLAYIEPTQEFHNDHWQDVWVYELPLVENDVVSKEAGKYFSA